MLAPHRGLAVDLQGNVIPFANVEVFRMAGGFPPAQVFSDPTTANSLGSTFQADAVGKFRFHAVAGWYRVRTWLIIDGVLHENIDDWVPIGNQQAKDFGGTEPGALFNFDIGTADEDPGAGNARFSDADISAADFLYVSKTSRAGNDVAGWLLGLAASTNPGIKAKLAMLRAGGDAQVFVDLTAVTDAVNYVKLAISNHSGALALADDDAVSLLAVPVGDRGAEGPQGNVGVQGNPGADGADGQSFQPSASVNLIAGRAAYDDAVAAFSVVVVSDSTNNDKETLYFKLSAASADWTDPIDWGTSGGGGEERIGIPFKIRASTPPAGAFAEDGSVILVATYPEFVAVTYCGDGNNATADFHYRCTDDADPTNTRDIAGAFFVLCDARGEFERGWDNGRGLDVGRSLWKKQLSALPNIVGNIAPVFLSFGSAASTGALRSTLTASGIIVGGAAAQRREIAFDAGDSDPTYGRDGATEVTPRNNASLDCIWFE